MKLPLQQFSKVPPFSSILLSRCEKSHLWDLCTKRFLHHANSNSNVGRPSVKRPTPVIFGTGFGGIFSKQKPEFFLKDKNSRVAKNLFHQVATELFVVSTSASGWGLQKYFG